MPRKATPNRTELAALHDKINDALTDIIDTDSFDMGLTDQEAGLLWCELNDLKADVVGAMFGQPPEYLKAHSATRLRLLTSPIPRTELSSLPN